MPTDLLPAPSTAAPQPPPPDAARTGWHGREVGHRPHRGRAVRRVALRRGRSVGIRDPHPRRGARGCALLPRRPRHHHRLPSAARAQVVRRPSVRSSSRSSEPVRWPSKEARSAGSPTTAAITSSPTGTMIPTRRTGAGWSPAAGALACPRRLAVQTTSRHRGRGMRPTSWPTATRRDERAVPRSGASSRSPSRSALGWISGGDVGAALSALLWAGRVRIFVAPPRDVEHQLAVPHVRSPPVRHDGPQHATSRALAVLTMGESWHNGHHAFPRSARHGLLPHEWDTSARAIRCFEQLGWATEVHWPTQAALARRRSSG